MIIGHLVRVRRKQRIFAADEKMRRALPPIFTVKEIVRSSGKERVRIFRRPEGTFGIAIDHAPRGETGWVPATSLGTGAVYASVGIAEREISLILPWCRSHEQKAEQDAPSDGDKHPV
jgi:hypothetical protein